MKVRFEVMDGDAVQRHASRLREIEEGITYPLTEDRFFVDHGPRYAAFFEGLGHTRFLVGFHGDELVGICAAAVREARPVGGRAFSAFYGGDLKLAPEARGKDVARQLFLSGFRLAFFGSALPRWDLAFGAAMQGERGDIRETFRGKHPGRMSSPLAILSVFFEPPARLRALDDGPGPLAPGVDLGRPGARPTVVRNIGTKEFRLVSSGARWPLVHLPWSPAEWTPGLGARLREGALALTDDEIACFAIDERLTDAHEWLASRGVHPGGTCTILSFAHPWRGPSGLRQSPWVHYPTSEI